MIKYSTQSISKSDIVEINKVLKSDYLTQGPKVSEFEKKISSFVKSKYSIAFNSATSALHASCVSLGVGKNDIVWTSPITFVSSGSCALMCGAKVDFVDIDISNFCISIDSLKLKLSKAKKAKKLPKVLINVHLGGLPANSIEIYNLSKKYNFKIIDDASHSLGSSYYHFKTGCGVHSHITVFSLHPLKIITTGEGGIATTNSIKLKKNLKLFSSHGISRSTNDYDSSFLKDILLKKYKYKQLSLGYNYRLTDIQSTLGISQLNILKKSINHRNKISKIYRLGLRNLKISFQEIDNDYISSFHLFIIRVLDGKSKRNKLMNFLEKYNIQTNIHYIPLYYQPLFKSVKLKNSEKYFNQCVSLPMHYKLNEKDVRFIISKIKKFYNDY
ncbi:DegT/DnrJ/EryC1/StrS aminotransferase family protein [Alphaproteobacteria bacterium]|nr:DegT/DnrJ/EryC1/StrS aminotransferase family protein [Alphaproteobacteria bacterium]